MTELVEFPDVELWVTGYLRAALAANGYPSVRVADTYAGTSPLEVWVQRDGGPALDVVRERPRVRVNCFADGPPHTAVNNLSRRVSTLMRAAGNQGPVRRVEQLSGPTTIPDSRPRRYMLFELILVGSPL